MSMRALWLALTCWIRKADISIGISAILATQLPRFLPRGNQLGCRLLNPTVFTKRCLQNLRIFQSTAGYVCLLSPDQSPSRDPVEAQHPNQRQHLGH